MVAGIYLITNKKTGQKYAGGSIDVERRIKQHINKPNNNSYIDNAIRKYGFDNFEWKIIEELPADWEIIGEREKYWISFHNTFKDPEHYNLTEGGKGISGWTHSEETRKKISENMPDQSGENNPFYGQKHTPEARKKISESNSGENHPMYGQKHTPESRKKMSENQKDFSGKNNPMWGKCGENNPKWKDYPRIIKAGKDKKGKQRYGIMYNGKFLFKSINKEKLYERWYDKYPNIELIEETE